MECSQVSITNVTVKVYEVFVAFQENSTDFEGQVSSQCDALVDAIQTQTGTAGLRQAEQGDETSHAEGPGFDVHLQASAHDWSAPVLHRGSQRDRLRSLPTGKSPEARCLQVTALKRISYR